MWVSMSMILSFILSVMRKKTDLETCWQAKLKWTSWAPWITSLALPLPGNGMLTANSPLFSPKQRSPNIWLTALRWTP
eukprot:CCRYP_007491-RC/>CCRYP_007491-RC protein AED:0.49 eAED:0.49 QI:0/-1/0/1/-1/0/1/0/77